MGTRMLHQRWIDVEHRRRRCVEKTLYLQIETTSKCRRRIDVEMSTSYRRRNVDVVSTSPYQRILNVDPRLFLR